MAIFGLALWVAGNTSANFANSAGFSGRNGFTCVSCHQPPSPQNDAVAHLEGLPASWETGVTYVLTVRVTGGPPAMPAPQAQGGFDLASSRGRLAGDPALLRTPSPQEITYLPSGTHQREWHVLWQAPDLRVRPAPAHFWLAVLAANGNHVIALNMSDSGETLDAAAALQAEAPPSGAAIAAWDAIPLLRPVANSTAGADSWTIDGSHTDANATTIAFSIDGAAWDRRDSATDWRLVIPGTSAHHMALRSEGAGRQSPELDLELGEPVSTRSSVVPPAAHAANAPAALTIAILFLSVATRRLKP